jgi:heptaprenyl diphosphate synthase
VSAVADDLLAPIAAELDDFERRLEATVDADLGPMGEAMRHIVRAGGKRLRPALVILTAGLGTADDEEVHRLAMAVEFIHTATLIHDDVIDDAPTRRGLATIHAMLGQSPAIIVGDYYFAKAANLMAGIDLPGIDLVLSRAVMTICTGELLQLTTRSDHHQSMEVYLTKIERKTATLLAASCHCGARVAGLDPAGVAAANDYGHNLGMAFQIADDILDYTATEEELGKPVAADLRQGTVTLPLMLALGDPSVAPELERFLSHDPMSDADYRKVVELVRASSGVDGAHREAHAFAERARAQLEAFPPSESRSVLEGLCDYVVARRI